ncbi:methyltransferase, partial [Pseudoalteromonas sp. S1691]|uniref:methyltransferase family protein n=1 Tax=Pseudoalteromonas sp. S1691 TaxID=579513 RepID=UPI001D2F248F
SLGRAPLVVVPSIPFLLLGSLIGACGIAVTLLSQIQMGDSWRIVVDQQERNALFTHGIYAKSRNPIYFVIFLFCSWVCITFPDLLLWACAFVCWNCIEVIVRQI